MPNHCGDLGSRGAPSRTSLSPGALPGHPAVSSSPQAASANHSKTQHALRLGVSLFIYFFSLFVFIFSTNTGYVKNATFITPQTITKAKVKFME